MTCYRTRLAAAEHSAALMRPGSNPYAPRARPAAHTHTVCDDRRPRSDRQRTPPRLATGLAASKAIPPPSPATRLRCPAGGRILFTVRAVALWNWDRLSRLPIGTVRSRLELHRQTPGRHPLSLPRKKDLAASACRGHRSSHVIDQSPRNPLRGLIAHSRAFDARPGKPFGTAQIRRPCPVLPNRVRCARSIVAFISFIGVFTGFPARSRSRTQRRHPYTEATRDHARGTSRALDLCDRTSTATRSAVRKITTLDTVNRVIPFHAQRRYWKHV